MHAPTSHRFKDNAAAALANAKLQRALGHVKRGFIERRAGAVARLPEFDRLRDQAKAIKDHVLENLDGYLEAFEAQVTANGGQLHWCRDSAEARSKVLEICRTVAATTATKGKSMVAEEIGLNAFLEANGITPIETDLGEYIIQLRGEGPSHIIAPAIHVNQDEVAEIFYEKHTGRDRSRDLSEAHALLNEAREELRAKYGAADVGITGANFLIAETGSSVIVTNEGNGDLTQTLAKCHIVIAGLEKIVPTLEDATTIMRVLARSATGQEQSVYTTISSGPRRPSDLDGPESYHVILLDNGRANMLGSEFQAMLRCIRCGACMNHCPVYGAIGGHAYGWVYPGPMGAVLTPSLIGVEEAGHLPHASSFCGRCAEVCPMHIPLPQMMRHWRRREFEQHLSPMVVRRGLRFWGFVAQRPRLYQIATRIKMRILGWIGARRGYFRHLPLATGWTRDRDFPAPQGQTFQALWDARGGARRIAEAGAATPSQAARSSGTPNRSGTSTGGPPRE